MHKSICFFTFLLLNLSSFTAPLQILTVFKHSIVSQIFQTRIHYRGNVQAHTWKLKGVGVCLKNDVLHKPQFIVHPPPLQKVWYEPSRGRWSYLSYLNNLNFTFKERVTATLWPFDQISRYPCK